MAIDSTETFQDEFVVPSSTTTSNTSRRGRRSHNTFQDPIDESRGSDVACSHSVFFLLVVMAIVILAITLGVTLPQQKQQQDHLRTGSHNYNNNNGQQQQPSSPSQPPSSSTVGSIPTSTTVHFPTPVPVETKEDYLRSVVRQWSGSEVDQPATPAHLALGWLSTIDPQNLGKNSTERDIRQRYIGAVIYFALQGQTWQSGKQRRRQRRELQEMRTMFGFLSGKNVCNWNMDSMGISCDGEGNIETIQLCKFHFCTDILLSNH